MKKSNWELIVITLASIGAVASLIVLIMCASSMVTMGVTPLKIWGIIGLIISFIMCVSIIGILVKNYRENKQLSNNVLNVQ